VLAALLGGLGQADAHRVVRLLDILDGLKHADFSLLQHMPRLIPKLEEHRRIAGTAR